MKKSIVWTTIYMLFVIGLVGCGGGGSDSGGSTNYFPLNLNSTHNYLITMPIGTTYTTYTQTATVIQADGSSAIIRYQNSNSASYSENSYVLYGGAIYYNKIQSFATTTTTTTISPDAVVLPANMATGTIASSTSSYSTGDLVSIVTRTITVIGPESVTVPAGTFQAIKVGLVNRSISGSGTTVTNLNYWYVEGVGRVKIESYDASTPASITTTVLTS